MKNCKTIMLVISIINASWSLWGMEEAPKIFEENFPGFTTINKKLLEKFSRIAPENRQHCGEIQRWHVIAWDHAFFDNEGLENLWGDPKINPAPQKFADSINSATFFFDAVVDSREDLDEEVLFTLVSKNIDENKPVMAYFQNEINILLTTIVGYNKDSSELLLIENAGRGPSRFMTITFNSFIELMDLRDIFYRIENQELDIYTRFKLAPLLENKKTWLPFTFIVFDNKKNKKMIKIPPSTSLENKVLDGQNLNSSNKALRVSSDKIRCGNESWLSSMAMCNIQ